MKVYFIGAGPGAADLITLRAKKLIETCPVILYAGSLVPEEVLSFAPEKTRKINTAPLSLGEIIDELKKAASEDKDVARLHSGDPSLYSAIAEQGALLKELGIDYEVVPGVPAFAAASAALGLELTLPEVNQTVILTRTSKRASAMPETESLKVLGASKALLAIHLSAKNTDHIVKELTPNYGEDCTVYITCDVTWPTEKLVKTTLKNLSETVKEHSIERTAIIFVGEALDQELVRKSALYDKDHNRHLKPAKD